MKIVFWNMEQDITPIDEPLGFPHDDAHVLTCAAIIRDPPSRHRRPAGIDRARGPSDPSEPAEEGYVASERAHEPRHQVVVDLPLRHPREELEVGDLLGVLVGARVSGPDDAAEAEIMDQERLCAPSGQAPAVVLERTVPPGRPCRGGIEVFWPALSDAWKRWREYETHQHRAGGRVLGVSAASLRAWSGTEGWSGLTVNAGGQRRLLDRRSRLLRALDSDSLPRASGRRAAGAAG